MGVRHDRNETDARLDATYDVERICGTRGFEPRWHEIACSKPEKIAQHDVRYRNLNTKISMGIQNVCIRAGRREDGPEDNEAKDEADHHPRNVALGGIVAESE